MFQTEPILFLQSFSNEILDIIFMIITSLGDREGVQFIIIAILFGIDFRKGVVLLHLVIWTAFATAGLKDFFALPRPFYVDAAVRAIGRNINPTTLKSMGADTFWGLPDSGAVDYLRAHRMGSFGFPSGHTSGAVALWGGIMVLFKKRWIIVACGLLIALIPLSRMYLGRHFPADVLGGYVLGGTFLLAACHTASRNSVKNFLYSGYQLAASKKETTIICLYLFGLPLLCMLAFPSHATFPAILLGLNLGFFPVRLNGLPDDSGTVFRRIMRIAVAGMIFLMTNYLFDLVFNAIFTKVPEFIKVYAVPVLMMACFARAAVETNIMLGLMKRKKLTA